MKIDLFTNFGFNRSLIDKLNVYENEKNNGDYEECHPGYGPGDCEPKLCWPSNTSACFPNICTPKKY